MGGPQQWQIRSNVPLLEFSSYPNLYYATCWHKEGYVNYGGGSAGLVFGWIQAVYQGNFDGEKAGIRRVAQAILQSAKRVVTAGYGNYCICSSLGKGGVYFAVL